MKKIVSWLIKRLRKQGRALTILRMCCGYLRTKRRKVKKRRDVVEVGSYELGVDDEVEEEGAGEGSI